MMNPLTDGGSGSALSAHERALHAALKLNLIPGIGPRTYADLVLAFGSPEQVFSAAPAELSRIPGVGRKLVEQIVTCQLEGTVGEQIRICRDHQIEVLTGESATYPDALRQIYDPPNVLFCHGSLLPADALAVAIVGTRHATGYGIRTADRLARALAMAGVTVVSGLARGIDAAAHRGALEAGGRTIAVLGGGLLNMYPPEHLELANRIATQGAVLSEALPGSAPKAGCFPRRNRIVSGISLGVVVVEAGARSGALISARLAMEQGREVFAVPGQIDNRMAQGCHRLLQDGAKLVQSVDDILDELGPLARPLAVEQGVTIRHPMELNLTDQESTILQAIHDQATEFEEIVAATGLPVARVLSTISVLEMKRLVRRCSGSSCCRN